MVFTAWILVGLTAGWLAGWVMTGRSDRAFGEIVRAAFHSALSTWILSASGISPTRGKFLLMVAAFVRAALI